MSALYWLFAIKFLSITPPLKNIGIADVSMIEKHVQKIVKILSAAKVCGNALESTFLSLKSASFGNELFQSLHPLFARLGRIHFRRIWGVYHLAVTAVAVSDHAFDSQNKCPSGTMIRKVVFTPLSSPRLSHNLQGPAPGDCDMLTLALHSPLPPAQN